MKVEQLTELNVPDEYIEGIINLHNEHVKELKAKSEVADAMSAQIEKMQSQLTEANKTIVDFKSMDIDEIKNSANDWKTKAETMEQDFNRKLEAVAKESFAKEYAAGFAFSSKAAKNQFIKDLIAENLEFKDSVFYGADDFTTKYTKADPEVFKSNEQKDVKVDFGAGHNNTMPNVDNLINQGIIGALKK